MQFIKAEHNCVLQLCTSTMRYVGTDSVATPSPLSFVQIHFYWCKTTWDPQVTYIDR